MSTNNPEPGTGPTCAKKRYLSPAECKQAAVRISAEMRTYSEDLNKWNRHGTARVCPLWGPDYDAVEMKINRLYHPDEAALILEALTP